MTATLSERTQAQVARKEAQIAETYASANLKAQHLKRQIQGLKENDHRKSARTDAIMTRDLRRYWTRQGKRQVRHLIPKGKGAGTLRRTFEAIYDDWKKAGKPFRGVPIDESDLAKRVGISRSQLMRVLDQLEFGLPHSVPTLPPSDGKACPRLRATSQGVILRIRRGKYVRFVVTLPESEPYHSAVMEAFQNRNAAGPHLTDDDAADPLTEAIAYLENAA